MSYQTPARVAAYASAAYRITGTTSPISGTLPVTPTQGNVLIAIVSGQEYVVGNYPVVTGITQTGVTWTQQSAIDQIYWSSPMWGVCEIWLGVVGAGALTGFSVAYSSTIAYGGGVVDVIEYTGVLTTGFLDKIKSNASVGAGASSTGTTATTTQTAELWIGAMYFSGGVTQSTPQNGFSLLDGALGPSNRHSLGYLEKIVSATGTASTGTVPSGYNYYLGCIATIKAAPVVGIQRFTLLNEMNY